MHRFYIQPEQMTNGRILISGIDVNHIKNVLRMKSGEQIIICDGKGSDYRCEIISLGNKEIWAKELSHSRTDAELPIKITLFQGIPKKDKMELIIQKAVELGVTEIVPVAMKRCIAKLEDAKREEKKQERWQTIAQAAAKQSGRGILPIITSSMAYDQALKQALSMDLILLPYEQARGMKHTKNVMQRLTELAVSAQNAENAEIEKTLVKNSIGIFIGPEGGFDPEEIEAAKAVGAEIISLGKRILRTETAGLALLSMLMYEIECGIEK